ncbi:MAG: hypothetical protein P8Z49_11240 [Acidobacteriota bacterium]
MNNSPRSVVFRLTLLILATCALSFAWDSHRNKGLQSVTGSVVKVRLVGGGNGGDFKEFTIRYTLHGRSREFTARRGILDAMGSLRDLGRDDRVLVAADPNPPYRAVFDTVNARYGVTLCFVSLGLIFGAAVLFLAFTGRLSPGQSNGDNNQEIGLGRNSGGPSL